MFSKFVLCVYCILLYGKLNHLFIIYSFLVAFVRGGARNILLSFKSCLANTFEPISMVFMSKSSLKSGSVHTKTRNWDYEDYGAAPNWGFQKLITQLKKTVIEIFALTGVDFWSLFENLKGDNSVYISIFCDYYIFSYRGEVNNNEMFVY